MVITPVGGGKLFFHAIDRRSSKQSRLTFTSIVVEIITSSTSTYRCSLMAERHQVLYDSLAKLPSLHTVHFNGLYSTIINLHEVHDYRLIPTVCRMRDPFETGEMYNMKWSPCNLKITDDLTKRNLTSCMILNKVGWTCILRDEIVQHNKRVTYSK